MNTEEFLNELEECLKGEVEEFEYADSVNYYRDYIREQIGQGYTESEVIDKLGSPRLIAKSIIDAHGVEPAQGGNEYYSGEGTVEKEQVSEKQQEVKNSLKTVGIIAAIIAVLLVIGVIFIRLLPIILVFVGVLLIVKLIRGE